MISITGLGYYVPEKIIPNSFFEARDLKTRL